MAQLFALRPSRFGGRPPPILANTSLRSHQRCLCIRAVELKPEEIYGITITGCRSWRLSQPTAVFKFPPPACATSLAVMGMAPATTSQEVRQYKLSCANG